RNLARPSCFPALRCLEFGEYNEKYMEDYATRCTPFADYQALFGAKAFKPVCRFVWRNPACSATKIGQLKALRPDLQLLVVRTSAEYVEYPPNQALPQTGGHNAIARDGVRPCPRLRSGVVRRQDWRRLWWPRRWN